MTIETERLILRKLTQDDFEDLYEILGDRDTMKFYPKPFTEEKVRLWISNNIERYEIFGFGLFAVILKESGKLIGDCGVTMQVIAGKIKPEIGYHINKEYQNNGFATEAAKATMDYIFKNTTFKKLYSYMKFDNTPSYKVAQKIGMKLNFEFADPVNEITKVYSISSDEL